VYKRQIDIKRISSKLRMPIGKFIDTYLKVDEDKDYVLKQSPCVFLSSDNTCDIYDDRPLACKEYPHTNRKNMFQILDLTLKNSQICPAVSKIFTELNLKK
jgi:Fe-S-cluster containining protein